MAFTPLSQEGVQLRRRRLLIAGTLGVGKTTALVEMLRSVRKTQPTATMAYLSYPGEKGHDSVPLDEPGLISRIWTEDATAKRDSLKLVNEVERETYELLAQKPTIWAGDGFHKFFTYLLDAVTGGAIFTGDEFEPRLYGRAYARAGEYLSRVMHSLVPIVAFTAWTRERPVRSKRPGETADAYKAVAQKVYPDLPPQLARTIVGEFSVAVVQTVRTAPVQDPEKLYAPSLLVKTPQKTKIRVWQTRAYGDVEGVGIKCPKEQSERIPTYIPASYEALAGYLNPTQEGGK